MDSKPKHRIVLANGCFDILHYGHVLHLEAAKNLGDRLIVSLTKSQFVNKGPGRPVFNDYERYHMLRSLRCVDGIFMVASSLEALEMLKPDVYVKGKEYEGNLPEKEYCDAHGIEV